MQRGQKPVKKTISQIIKPRYIFIFCLLAVIALSTILLTQQTKMEDIQSEYAALDEEYNSLLTEEQRIENMIEYMQSDEYLLQYARETYGYVYSDDIKFYKE